MGCAGKESICVLQEDQLGVKLIYRPCYLRPEPGPGFPGDETPAEPSEGDVLTGKTRGEDIYGLYLRISYFSDITIIQYSGIMVFQGFRGTFVILGNPRQFGILENLGYSHKQP
jgi:hypothetical protein